MTREEMASVLGVRPTPVTLPTVPRPSFGALAELYASRPTPLAELFAHAASEQEREAD